MNGLCHRYFVVIDLYKEAIDSGDDLDYQRFYQQQSDVCMLRLFDSFGESAPQLIFYLYVIIGSDFVFKFFSQSSQIFSHKKNWHKNDWIQKLRNLPNFTFWFIELTKTPMLLNCQVPNGYFCISLQVIYDYLAFASKIQFWGHWSCKCSILLSLFLSSPSACLTSGASKNRF